MKYEFVIEYVAIMDKKHVPVFQQCMGADIEKLLNKARIIYEANSFIITFKKEWNYSRLQDGAVELLNL